MRWWAILATVAVAGCGPAETVSDAPTRADEAGPDSCNAASYQPLVGGPVSAFDQSTISDPVRIIPPGSIVTTEYNPTRLNVDLDGRNQIVRFWCG